MHNEENLTRLSLDLVQDANFVLRILNRARSDGGVEGMSDDEHMVVAETLANVVGNVRSLCTQLRLDWNVVSDPKLMDAT